MAIRKTGSATGEVTGVEQDGQDGMRREGSLPPLPPRWAAEDDAALAEENAAADGSDG